MEYLLVINVAVFIYGGDLGKPQGLDFMYKIMLPNNNRNDCFFIIAGSEAEYKKIEKCFVQNNFTNAKLFSLLPKYEYGSLLQPCGAGLIF
jgi:hypothetical protein